ncbi:MAG: hypothetical protein NTW86_05875, partial [Candidatus Sumerlaeota bacterium]|nr:hypothetical protein [Candidatus Sumerlaeota bacterium]
SWLVTENAAAWAAGAGEEHLAAAVAWAAAMLAMEEWDRDHPNLSYASISYALCFLVDLCGTALDAGLRRRIEEKLWAKTQWARKYFTSAPPGEFPYTQNHFFIPLTAYIASLALLRETRPEAESFLCEVSAFPRLILESLGGDGYYYEGFDYFHFSIGWLIRLADVCERGLGMDLARLPFFTRLKHYLYWYHFPRGRFYFNTGDAEPLEINFGSWSELAGYAGRLAGGAQPFLPRPDTHIQNHSHVLYWVGWKTGDPQCRAVADAIRARGLKPCEAFWMYAWDAPGGGSLPAEPSHRFEDFGVWAADHPTGAGTLRLLARCGPPLGHSLRLVDGKPAHRYNAGHTHPDNGGVYAAIDDVPILLGAGYLGRKASGFANTITINGKGQGDDRHDHPMNGNCIDYRRLLDLSCEPMERDGRRGARMDFTAAYRDDRRVRSAVREVAFGPGARFDVLDRVELAAPAFIEARFRIAEKPVLDGMTLRWSTGPYSFSLHVVESDAPVDLFVYPGEVIAPNFNRRLDGIAYALGNLNQRGYQAMVRSAERVTAASWTIRFEIVR